MHQSTSQSVATDSGSTGLPPAAWDVPVDEQELGPVLPHRPIKDDSDMDITPMIDITFLLLIYFLISSVPNPNTTVQLAKARYGKGVLDHDSVILTIVDGGRLA